MDTVCASPIAHQYERSSARRRSFASGCGDASALYGKRLRSKFLEPCFSRIPFRFSLFYCTLDLPDAFAESCHIFLGIKWIVPQLFPAKWAAESDVYGDFGHKQTSLRQMVKSWFILQYPYRCCPRLPRFPLLPYPSPSPYPRPPLPPLPCR